MVHITFDGGFNLMAGVSELLSYAPKFNFSGAIPWIVGIVVFVGILIIITIISVYFLSFKQKIVMFRNVAGYTRPIGKDSAKLVRISKAGDYLMFTRKTKKWLPRPTIESSKNTWWYFIREDGEWINFAMADLDEDMKKAGAFYVDQDMRMTRVANEKLLRERLQGDSFLQKYGTLLMSAGFLLLLCVFLLIFLWKYNDIITASASVMDQADLILQRANNLGVGGATGQLIPAG